MYVPTARLLDVARATLAGKSRSYVADAILFAKVLIAIGMGVVEAGLEELVSPPAEEIERLRRQVRQLEDHVTGLQKRGTELVEENRDLRVQVLELQQRLTTAQEVLSELPEDDH